MSSPTPPPARAWPKIIFLLALVAVALFGVGRLHLAERITHVLEWVRTLGPRGPLFFIGAYVLASVLSVPCFPLTVGAGALFGPVWGTAWVSIGSTLGSTASFLISRFVARDWVMRRLG